MIQFSLMWLLTHVLFWTALGMAGGFAAFNDKLAPIGPHLVVPAGPENAYGTFMAALTPADVEEAGIRLWFMILHPVLAGLMSSAAVASIMSTADSFLILLVSTVARDFLNRFFMPTATEQQRLRVGRILVAVLAVLAFIVAIRPPWSSP